MATNSSTPSEPEGQKIEIKYGEWISQAFGYRWQELTKRLLYSHNRHLVFLPDKKISLP